MRGRFFKGKFFNKIAGGTGNGCGSRAPSRKQLYLFPSARLRSSLPATPRRGHRQECGENRRGSGGASDRRDY